MQVLDVASGGGGGRGFQKHLNHLTSYDYRMTVLALKFRDYRPSPPGDGGNKGIAQVPQRGMVRRRAVDQRDHSGVASTIEDLLQSRLQGTELSPFRCGVAHQKSPV